MIVTSKALHTTAMTMVCTSVASTMPARFAAKDASVTSWRAATQFLSGIRGTAQPPPHPRSLRPHTCLPPPPPPPPLLLPLLLLPLLLLLLLLLLLPPPPPPPPPLLRLPAVVVA